MSEKPSRQVACPQCKKLIEYSLSNKFRPFCSERCQLIDLGDWANENYKIPDKKPLEEDDEFN
jgi:uncharacterized protein